MDYNEYNICIEVLQNKPKWFFRQDNIRLKLECLEKFNANGTPANIQALISSLKDGDESVRLRTAEVILALFRKLKSQNQLYESLKYLPIEKGDIDYYRNNFTTSVAVNLLAIASLNSNGYVREKATIELAALQHPNAIRYIIFRLGDWVDVVRKAAGTAMRTYFADAYTEVFIGELQTIESLQKVERIDLSLEYNSIIQFIASKELTIEFYQSLHVSDKARLLYVRNYFKRNNFNQSFARLLISDKSLIIRTEVLKHIDKLSQNDHGFFINRLLQDSSSQVRLSALYFIKGDLEKYENVIYQLTSDGSASIRDLSRYLLKGKGYDFEKIYRERIKQKKKIVGSILGLMEVGSNENLEVFNELIAEPDIRTKIACLKGIHRFDPSAARRHSLNLLAHSGNKIRNKCNEILAVTWDAEVLETVHHLYQYGDFEQKKTILRLYNRVGGWDVINDLILAISDSDSRIRNLAWSFLQKWVDKALRLFTTPPGDILKRAVESYTQTDTRRNEMTAINEKLWKELKYYLR